MWWWWIECFMYFFSTHYLNRRCWCRNIQFKMYFIFFIHVLYRSWRRKERKKRTPTIQSSVSINRLRLVSVQFWLVCNEFAGDSINAGVIRWTIFSSIECQYIIMVYSIRLKNSMENCEYSCIISYNQFIWASFRNTLFWCIDFTSTWTMQSMNR